MSKATTSSVGMIPKTYPVRDLQRRYAAILTWVKEAKRPALLMNKSFPQAVLIDIETYNELVGDPYEYDVKFVLDIDRKALKAHRQGKTKKLRSLRDLTE